MLSEQRIQELARTIKQAVLWKREWEIEAALRTAAREAAAAENAEKDEAYRQRNVLVSTLARIFPSGIRRTTIEGWSEDWHGCCYIDLPSGQISYHYHDSHAQLFDGLPQYQKKWDGHDKQKVEDRLAAIRARREKL